MDTSIFYSSDFEFLEEPKIMPKQYKNYKLFTSSYPHQFYKRKLYKANPQRPVSGGQLAVYSRGALQRRGGRGGEGEERRRDGTTVEI